MAKGKRKKEEILETKIQGEISYIHRRIFRIRLKSRKKMQKQEFELYQFGPVTWPQLNNGAAPLLDGCLN